MHLDRFFVPVQDKEEVQYDGPFVSPPRSPKQLFGNTDIKRWSELCPFWSVVLLGPPRQGKTTELEHQCALVDNGFFLPLRELPDPPNVSEFQCGIRNEEQWEDWLNSDELGELFVDALDEGKLISDQIINNLCIWIKGLGDQVRDRLRIHLSCRTADWMSLERDRWLGLFSRYFGYEDSTPDGSSVAVVELLNLDKAGYAEYCRSKNIDSDQLLESTHPRIERFLGVPQTLKMMADLFAVDNRLPQDIASIFDKAVGLRLSESNRRHRRIDASSPDIVSRRSIAEYYATATILSGREFVSQATYQETDNSVPMGSCPDFATDECLATLKSGLFREPLAEYEYRFDDPGIADYLAAVRLNRLIEERATEDKAKSAKTVHRLFFSSPESSEPVPALRGALSWLCVFNAKIRKLTLERNHNLFLCDYPGDLDDDTKIAIWDRLVEQYGDRDYFDTKPWKSGIGVLACPGIVDRLVATIGNTEICRHVRELAILIAHQGGLTETVPSLVESVSNTDDDLYVLTAASEALGDIAPQELTALKPWLDLAPEADPYNRLLGQALRLLWPEHIGFSTVVAKLRPSIGPRDLFGFLYGLSSKLDPEQRELVADRMVDELNGIRSTWKDSNTLPYSNYPSEWIVDFVIDQIEAWKERQSKWPKLEKWISTILQISNAIPIHYHESIDKIQESLEGSDSLRRQLARLHLERIFREKIKKFQWNRYLVPMFFWPQKQDLQFWQETVVEYSKLDFRLLSAAWWSLMKAWEANEWHYDFIEWAKKEAVDCCSIECLWKWYNNYPIHKWRQEKHARNSEQKEKRRRGQQQLLSRLDDIKSGDINLLVPLFNSGSREGEDIKDRFGEEIADAYRYGLHFHWTNCTIPLLAEYHCGTRIPWECLFVVEAVKEWSAGDHSFTDLSEAEIRCALQAGLSKAYGQQEWFKSLAKERIDVFSEIAFKALGIESASNMEHPTVARFLKQHNDEDGFSGIALDYLTEHPDAAPTVSLSLAQAAAAAPMVEETISIIKDKALDLIGGEEEFIGLQMLAIAWKKQPEAIWQYIRDDYLNGKDEPGEAFQGWIVALEEAHDFGSGWHWPAWVEWTALAPMLEAFYLYCPPSGDYPGGFENGGREVTTRSNIGQLRGEAMNIVIHSGESEAYEAVAALAGDGRFKESYTDIVNYLDKWPAANAARYWIPVTIEQLDRALNENIAPIRNHEELFQAVVDVIAEISFDVTNGEAGSSRLFWDDSRKCSLTEKCPTVLQPGREYKLQMYYFDVLRFYSRLRAVSFTREGEVSDGKKFDIKAEITLPNSKRAKVYIEIKRQMNKELVDSPETQLVGRYLRDPESRYGIYLVGWYGPDHYGGTKENLRSLCGVVPTTAKDLENCLQTMADDIVSRRRDVVQGLKVIVVDLSLPQKA